MIKTTTIKTKRGAASLFVVIFTIILLGVIVLGFTRLILSEAGQTTNSDLSQSAYDSALTGIEDAKVALLKYHDCISQGKVAGSATSEPGTCEWYIYAMQNGMNNQSCDVVSDVLSRSTAKKEDGEGSGEVIVQETQNTSDTGNADYMAQAYTCVTIQEELNDYRSTVTPTSRVRIVPIRVGGTKNGTPYNINNVGAIRIHWHIPTGDESLTDQNTFVAAGDSTAKNPAVLGVQFFQADGEFHLSELSAANGEGRTDRASIYLKPSTSGDNLVSKSEMSASANKAQDYANGGGEPHPVKCQSGNEYYCTATLEVPATFRGESRNQGASFLLVTLPYGQPQTDFSIELLENASSSEPIPMSGVQARIDSTGRANDLYRRVESRVELVDTYFPYPEFTIQMTNGANSDIEKSFWVTNNCWYSENGEKKSCGSNDAYDRNKSINSQADSNLPNL